MIYLQRMKAAPHAFLGCATSTGSVLSGGVPQVCFWLYPYGQSRKGDGTLRPQPKEQRVKEILRYLKEQRKGKVSKAFDPTQD
jgi:hypothetical protein